MKIIAIQLLAIISLFGVSEAASQSGYNKLPGHEEASAQELQLQYPPSAAAAAHDQLRNERTSTTYCCCFYGIGLHLSTNELKTNKRTTTDHHCCFYGIGCYFNKEKLTQQS